MPSYSCGTILSPTEFRDELRDRYGLPLLNPPENCDGCTQKFSISHSFGCKVGGLVTSRQNGGRDTLICLESAGFMPSNVRDEPIINPSRDAEGNQTLKDPASGLEAELCGDRGDIPIRGFWEQSTDCIIDVRISDVNQPSYLRRQPSSILKGAETEKKRKYLAACLEQRRHFTPFVVSCEGMTAKEAAIFMCRIAKKL